MLGSPIMELVRRRRDEFVRRFAATADGVEADRSRAIALEYDRLLAEIQVLEYTRSHPHWAPKIEENPSEQWILGDQGQLGG